MCWRNCLKLCPKGGQLFFIALVVRMGHRTVCDLAAANRLIIKRVSRSQTIESPSPVNYNFLPSRKSRLTFVGLCSELRARLLISEDSILSFLLPLYCGTLGCLINQDRSPYNLHFCV
ncbi:hypothetical protein BDV23DRAFT_146672 [Aspergillus alliaceus]|uniref:Secreted protein n=1 Tax=Petromyces alliaceus TaxID=209559 RepID=A0A5N7CN59_PETAA|nr:hypothetical protein BDV23DRAFT_146672 [Aspergillus alliaceus]